MINMSKLVSCVAICLAVIMPAIRDSAVAADATASVEILSAYVYHGVTYNDGLVAQPNLDVSSGNIGFNVWASFDIDDYDGALQGGEFSEVDLSVYTFGTIAGLDCSLTYSEYLYPHVADGDGAPLGGNKEIIATAEKGITEGLKAKVAVYYEIDEVKDFYAYLKLMYGMSPMKNLDLNCSGLIGYSGKDKSLAGKEGLHEYTLSIGASYAVSETVSMSATIYHSAALDEDVLPDQDVETFGGIGVSWTL